MPFYSKKDKKQLYLSFTMRKLYLFNPENDMALASGSPYYMAPSSAKKMADDLAVLPAWYAEEGSEVLLRDKRHLEWLLNECGHLLSVKGSIDVLPMVHRIVPWGWSPALLRQFRERGFPDEALITDCQMSQIREFSSRKIAVSLLPRIRIEGTVGSSYWFSSVDDVKAFVASRDNVLLKSPWSGSGKGIQKVSGMVDENVYGWIKRIVMTQGGIVGEPFYDKVEDFAMEFYVTDDGICFIGYSLFETDSRGIYKGNWLAADSVIEKRLSSYVPVAVLNTVRDLLLRELSSLLQQSYRGYLGIDMMIVRADKGYAVHPLVEMNLRMNMGVVARLFHDRFVCTDACGVYVVEYYAKKGEALSKDNVMKNRYPLVLENKRIRSGYKSLTPIFEDTAYQVFVLFK